METAGRGLPVGRLPAAPRARQATRARPVSFRRSLGFQSALLLGAHLAAAFQTSDSPRKAVDFAFFTDIPEPPAVNLPAARAALPNYRALLAFPHI